VTERTFATIDEAAAAIVDALRPPAPLARDLDPAGYAALRSRLTAPARTAVPPVIAGRLAREMGKAEYAACLAHHNVRLR
jgi:hypothetical protein